MQNASEGMGCSAKEARAEGEEGLEGLGTGRNGSRAGTRGPGCFGDAPFGKEARASGGEPSHQDGEIVGDDGIPHVGEKAPPAAPGAAVEAEGAFEHGDVGFDAGPEVLKPIFDSFAGNSQVFWA